MFHTQKSSKETAFAMPAKGCERKPMYLIPLILIFVLIFNIQVVMMQNLTMACTILAEEGNILFKFFLLLVINVS